MTIELKPEERLDDLQRNGFKIIQNPGKFCFGMDAVLLSGFAKVKQGEKVLDLGTGTGIIPILLAGKTKAGHLTGLEIQEESADMARRSVLYNHLEDRVSIVEGDIKEAGQLFDLASFDVITSNPPYMTGNHGLTNPELPQWLFFPVSAFAGASEGSYFRWNHVPSLVSSGLHAGHADCLETC